MGWRAVVGRNILCRCVHVFKPPRRWVALADGTAPYATIRHVPLPPPPHPGRSGDTDCSATASPIATGTAAKAAAAPTAAVTPTHYENFPVASWLCPSRLRPPIAAIYGFARTADDIADEGEAPAAQRLADLRSFRADLATAARGSTPSARWPEVFGPLANAIACFALPEALLADLLSAFAQDVENTGTVGAREFGDAGGKEGARSTAGAGNLGGETVIAYQDRTELLDYCARSANPVGRLLLHLYGIHDAASLAQSDAICSALQLINFWQDLSVDLPRGRFYVPRADCAAHGLTPEDFKRFRPLALAPPAKTATNLIAAEAAWARELMQRGAPLVRRLPGRAGWELRFVVQGGLRILDKIEALGFDTFSQRPTVNPVDAPLLAWRALLM